MAMAVALAAIMAGSASAGDVVQSGAGSTGNNCLARAAATSSLTTAWCQGGSDQVFELAERKRFKHNGQCLQSFDDNSVRFADCRLMFEQEWRARGDGTIAAVGYKGFGKCLQAGASRTDGAVLAPCNPTVPSQVFRSSLLLAPERGEVLYAGGPDRCLDWSGSVIYPYYCHGSGNQVWTYTFDSELRINSVADMCLEFDDVNWKSVTLAKCSGGDKQRWTLDNGRVGPAKESSKCLDLATSPATLAQCSSKRGTQAFDTQRVLAARSRGLKRTVVQGPWVFVGTNCMTADRVSGNVFLHPCQSQQPDYWWEYSSTTSRTFRLPGDKCLDMALTSGATHRVSLATCHGQLNQQWDYDATTGMITSLHDSGAGKCLSFNTVNVTAFTTTTFEMQPCTTRKDNQYFHIKELSTVPPPPSDTLQASYCAQRNAPANTGARALSFLRESLSYAVGDFKYLVPSVLDDKQAHHYYSNVVLETLSLALGGSSALGYGPIVESDVVAKLTGTGTTGTQVLLELAQLMCHVREKPTEYKAKIASFLHLDQPSPNTRLVDVVSYMRVGSLQLLASSGALASDASAVTLMSTSIARTISSALRGLIASGDLLGLIRFIESEDMTWFVVATKPICTATPSLAVCTIAATRELAVAKIQLLDAITTTYSTTALMTNEYLPVLVQDKAAAFMAIYRRVMAMGAYAIFPQSLWVHYTQWLVFGSTKPVVEYPLAALLRTMATPELVVVLAVWPYFTPEEMTPSAAWTPFFTALSDQLYAARRREIGRIVFRSPARSLEAYMDGRTSDMASLVSEALPRICARFQSFTMCDLASFHALTTARAALQRTLSASNGVWDDQVDTLAASFAAIFTAKSAQNDELWTVTAQRLVFNSVQLQAFVSNTLLLRTSARPAAFLLSYTVLAQYTNGMAPLLPFFSFLLDQVATAHFSGMNALVTDRDVDGMVAYMHPQNNATLSDLGVLGPVVLPRVCNNPNNPVLSICKLQEFYVGLQQVVSFEKERTGASNKAVLLAHLAEVDVRKQLDVIDGENKQFEIITAIQDAANQVGAKIQEESTAIQALVAAESAEIRGQLDASTQVLYDKMGDEGRALQSRIDASTRLLEDTIGDAADAIRQDIARHTKILYDKMDADARALQKSIDDNTRKLSTQIGAEAAATRGLIKEATAKLYDKIGEEGRAIRGKIDESTNKLHNKIGEEGRAIRTKIDQSTDKLYNKIGQEGQKTRDKIDASTRELTGVINRSTARLEGKIDASTKEIVGKVRAGFTSLGNYFKSDSSVALRTLLAQIKQSSDSSTELMDGLRGKVDALVASLNEAASHANGAAKAQAVLLGIQMGLHVGQLAMEAAKCFNPFAVVFGEADPFAAAEAAIEISKDVSKVVILDEDTRELAKKGREFADSAKAMGDVVTDFMGAQAKLSEFNGMIQSIGQSEALSPALASQFISIALDLYDNLEMPGSATELEVLADKTASFLNHVTHIIGKTEVGLPAAALSSMRRASGQVTPVFAAFKEIFEELNTQFAKLGEATRVAASAQSAGAIGVDSRRRRLGLATTASATSSHNLRRLAPSPPFKPFYSMAYAGLSRLFMQYRIQKAALDFCKFYAYKLGGMAPAMCNTPAKFFSPQDIQKMRAYSPPTFKTYSIAALLPTRPTPVGSDPPTSLARPRPFLDLDKLLNGERVPFALPTSDLAWLKKYNWILRTDTAASLAGVYIQSMQIVLPFTSVTGGNGDGDAGAPFDMVAKVAIAGSGQRLGLGTGAKSNRTYVLPRTELQFTTAINAQLCPSEMTNPYHQAAKCVASDGASSLCVYEDASVTRTDLLPSLFSSWTISSPAELVNQPGASYKLALPANNANSTVDLNVIVLLKVVRVTSSNTATVSSDDGDGEGASIAAAAEPQCCAADEYFARSACTKCPVGSTGALNGYACQRV